MEIIINKLSYNELNELSFKIEDSVITGITGKGKSTVLRLINGLLSGKGTIKYNGEKYTSKNKLNIIKQVSLVDCNFSNMLAFNTVMEYMLFYVQYYKLNIHDPKKKIEDSLRIASLSEKVLTRNIISLSSSEKMRLSLATALLNNPKIILFDEPFLYLDNKNEKKFARLIDQLNDKYNINIVIATNDSEMLYKYTKKVILLKDNTVFMEGDTKEVYGQVELLKDNNFEIPDIVLFTYLAKNRKNIKIDYHRDIRDLIKDIYKHV